MHATYFEITPHSDTAWLDLEDGLIRQTAAALIATASTIDEIVVDVPRQRPVPFGTGVDGSPATACITAADERDAQPDLRELLAAVATVSDSWPATVSTLREVDRDWPGSVTPGVKLRLTAAAAPGIDRPSFGSWLVDAVHRCADRCESVIAMTTIENCARDDAEVGQFLAVAGFSFPDDAALDEALSLSTFAPFVESEMIARESLRAVTVCEHRIRPNPNAWT